MKAIKGAMFGLGILAGVCLSPQAMAQQYVDVKKTDRVEYYHAPHEIQLIDDRPAIRDFREAPQPSQQIQLPPGPQGGGGGGGGGQGGAAGSPGGGYLPYRTGTPGMGRLPLDRAGFGNFSNIPTGGLGPRTALPNGQNTGVHAKQMTPTPTRQQSVPGQGGRSAPVAQQPRPQGPAASYNSNYTQVASGGSGGSGGGGGASANVKGVLLSRLKGK